MDINIRYQDIIDRCEKLSSFESEGRYDANGESRYLEIHINEVDKQLIIDYIKQAQGVIEERISRMITEVVESEDIIRIEKPDNTPSYGFEGIASGSELAKYEIIEGPQSSVGYGIIKFLDYGDTTSTFAYCVQGNDSYGTEGFKAYTDESVLGEEYLFESGVKKIYLCNEDKKEYTWHERGITIIPFERKPIVSYEVVKGFVWRMREDTRWGGYKTFAKHVTEAIVSYAMAAWLKGRLDDRVPFYESVFNNSMSMAVKNIYTKQIP